MTGTHDLSANISYFYGVSSDRVYSSFLDCAFFVNLAFCVALLLLILYRSGSEMLQYRFHLMSDVVCGFILTVHLTLWRPVLLTPHHFVYSNGFYAHLPASWRYLPLTVLFCLLLLVLFSNVALVINRYIYLTPESRVYRVYQTSKFCRIFYFTVFGALFALMQAGVVLLFSGSSSKFESVKESVLSRSDVLRPIFDKFGGSIAGFDLTFDGGMSPVVMNGLLILLIALALVVAAVHVAFSKKLKKHSQNEYWFDLQTALLRQWTVQTLSKLTVLTVPVIVALALGLFGVDRAPQWSVACISVLYFHGFVDYCCIGCFIPVYRAWIKHKLVCILCNMGADCKRHSVNEHPSTEDMLPSTSFTAPVQISSCVSHLC